MAFSAAVVGAGATIGGGLISAGAAKKAASQQAAEAQQALDFQQQVYQTGQQNLQPFIGTGTNALAALSGFYGLPGAGGTAAGTPGGNALQSYQAFTQTPFYTFPLQQGTQAIQQATAASGLNLTPGTISGIGKFAQNYASQNFNQYISGLSGLASGGQTAAQALAGFGTNQANLASNIMGNLGTAQASGTTGQANALQQALSGIPALFGAGSGTTGSSYGGGGGGTGGGMYANSPLLQAIFGAPGGGGGSSVPGGNLPL